MFVFVKIDSATSQVVCFIVDIVVAESDLEFIECGTNILNFTFITSVWIN